MANLRVLIVCLCCLCGLAQASSLEDLAIHVRLHDDGSADIVQTWQVDVHGSGSEFYLPQGNLGDMEIREFSVSDESGRPFIDEGWQWNSQRSAAEKAGRYGMVKTDQGYELCWGRGAEGAHTYRVAWTFTRALKAYDDYDGFNLRLVNNRFSPAPKKLKITLEKPGQPFAPETVHMWAFGFTGTILPQDGKIVVTPTAEFGQENYVNVMLRFDKGLFSPLSRVAGSFTDLQDQALAGAKEAKDAEEELDLWTLFQIVVVGGMFGVVAFFCLIYFPLRWLFRLPGRIRMRRKYGAASMRFAEPLKYFENLDAKDLKQLEAAPWYREIPCQGSLLMSNLLIQHCSLAITLKKVSLVEAYFLRLVQKGVLQIQTTGEAGGVSLRIHSPAASHDGAAALTARENRLFQMLRQAAGDNAVLEKDEFSHWAKAPENISRLGGWMDWQGEAREELRQAGAYQDEILVSHSRRGRARKRLGRKLLTDEGKTMLQQVIGFRKYLLDFTLIDEKRTLEVALWDDYLVFAALFNCARQVGEELLRLRPDFAASSSLLHAGAPDPCINLAEVSALAVIFQAAAGYPERYERSSDSDSDSDYSSSSGGSSYSSGGDGYSGGGSGGGER